MIKLDQPSLAIKTFNVPGPAYRMDQSIKLTNQANAQVVATQIQLAVTRSPQSYLKNVVINCHGGPGYLYIGEVKVKYLDTNGKKQKDHITNGIGSENVGLFAPLKGSIGTIWIVACLVMGESIDRAGRNFCPQLAVAAGCNVVVGNVNQLVKPAFLGPFPKDCIDDYEGTVYIFDANGKRGIFQQGKKI